MRNAFSADFQHCSSVILFLLLTGILCHLYTSYTYKFISTIHFLTNVTVILFMLLLMFFSNISCIKRIVNNKLSPLLFFLCGILINSLLVSHPIQYTNLQSTALFVGTLLILASGLLAFILIIVNRLSNRLIDDHLNNGSYIGMALWLGFTLSSLKSYLISLNSLSSLLLLILFNITLIIDFILLNEKRWLLYILSILSLTVSCSYLVFEHFPSNMLVNSTNLSKSDAIHLCCTLHAPLLVTYIIIFALYLITFSSTFNRINFTYNLWDKISIKLYIFLCLFYATFQMIFILDFISSFIWYKWLPTVLFIIFAFLWVIVHFLCFLCLSRLACVIHDSDRVQNCLDTKRYGLNRIWASQGVRFLAVISRAKWILAILITICCLIISILMGFIQPQLLFSFQISFLMDCYLVSIFHHLSLTIGPNAIGYALIRQVSLQKSYSTQSSFSTEITDSPTQWLNGKFTFMNLTTLIESFFAHFSIHNFGCVYSSGVQFAKTKNQILNTDNYLPLSIQCLQGIVNFFRQSLSHGNIRYDTYLLYYSGPDNNEGDWVFEDSSVITLKSLIDAWEVSSSNLEVNKQTHSRLLIILDTLHSEKWYNSLIKSSTHCYIALQSSVPLLNVYTSHCASDLLKIGQFTELWINVNIEAINTGISIKKLHTKLKCLQQVGL
ncbi:Transmembrane protein isoform 3 [Schistosoma japonicum]|uniref:Transmembrane protein 168 n=1 Tax=Schistosoma japonicum TaxID=6182 RepID=A0A4Z2CQX6_SCHJA|nr:Transmembrane protein isoform 3 [Schistosoma japonicum]